MTIENTVTAIASISITGISVIGIAGYIGKKIVTHFLNLDLAKFKSDIESSAKKQIEEYKSELEKERLTLQIKYGGIFEIQAKSILSLYKELEHFSLAATTALSESVGDNDKKEAFRQKFFKLKDEYIENRILLPESVDELYNNLFYQIFINTNLHVRYEEYMHHQFTDEAFDKMWKAQDKATKVLQEEIPKIKEELITNFRFLLGIQLKESKS